MSLMDMFRTSAPAPAPAPAPVALPASVGATKAETDGTNQQVNPLDAYSKLWESSAKTDTPPALNLDSKVLDEVSGSLDFTAGVPQEIMQKALSGDSKAILDIMKQVSQRAYREALHHSTSLTDKYLGARSAHDLSKVQGKVRSELTSNALSAIPNAQHPAIQHQLRVVAEQMQAQNPDAQPADIAKAAQQYVLDLASALNPAPSEKSKQDGTDWDAYFS